MMQCTSSSASTGKATKATLGSAGPALDWLYGTNAAALPKQTLPGQFFHTISLLNVLLHRLCALCIFTYEQVCPVRHSACHQLYYRGFLEPLHIASDPGEVPKLREVSHGSIQAAECHQAVCPCCCTASRHLHACLSCCLVLCESMAYECSQCLPVCLVSPGKHWGPWPGVCSNLSLSSLGQFGILPGFSLS